jgi:energy-coupling factor transport system ATP-binding protein
MPVIELKDVTFTYSTASRPAVSDFNLTVEAGSLVALVGRSGAGKTTVCDLIRGFAPRFHRGELIGTVTVAGSDIADCDLGLLATQIGFVFQNPFVQISGATDTVFEEVAFGLENLGVPVEQIRRRVRETLEMLSIAHLSDLNPAQLSGGQKQRVAFASTVAMDPPIYVVDEPTSQLDPQGTEQIFAIVQELKAQGKTIVLVEHKMELLAEHADHVVVLDGGRTALSGTPTDVFARPELAAHGVTRPQYAALGIALAKAGLWNGQIPVTRREAIHLLETTAVCQGGKP